VSILLCATLVSEWAWAQSQTAVSKQLLEQLTGHLEVELHRANVPAAALVVIDTTNTTGSQTTIQTFGSASKNTPFRLGSISKTFTALALLHAADKTNTPLSSPAAPIVGAAFWSNPFREKNPVTLGQLLELSAGFSDISSAEFASAVPVERKQALQIHRATHVTHWQPGQLHSYSNLAPAFTALAVEALTKMPFESYLHRHVLTPLGLPSASLNPLPNLPGGYKADGETLIPYWHTIYPAFGGLNATPEEFSNFLRKLTSNNLGDALTAAKRHRGSVPLYQPLTTAAARAGLTQGYGTGIYSWERDGYLFAGHGGDADGYRSRYAIMPQAKRGYFLVINTDNPRLLNSLTQTVEEYLTAGLPIPNRTSPQETQRTAAAHALLFTGKYVRASQRFNPAQLARCDHKQPTLSVENGEILWQRGNRTQILLPISKGLYRKNNKTIASVALVYVDGKRQLQGELGNWQHAQDSDRCSNQR